MSKIEIEGVGIGICGEEENYIKFLDDRESLGITNILTQAGAEPLYMGHESAIIYSVYDPEFWGPMYKEYQEQSGRTFPPAYKIKITVEVEQIPDAESDILWQKRVEKRE